MIRRFLRWAGFEHTGPYRIRAKHWWEWRRANRIERYLNWQFATYRARYEREAINLLLHGGIFRPPDGFIGLGIGHLLDKPKGPQ